MSLQEIMIAVEIGLIYGILAIGIYLTFETINFPDLTCDGSFVTGAIVSSVMIKSGANPFFGLIGAISAGGAAGFITGIINVKFKIKDLLSGIITAFMLYSINLRITGANPNISVVGEKTIFESGEAIIICGITVGALIFFLTYLLSSDFGLGLRAVGKNPQFASANGINPKGSIVFGLILSNAIIGLCGAVFSQYQGFGDVSQGAGCLVIGLASVIIGEKIFSKSIVTNNFSRRAEIRNFLKIFLSIFACVIGSVAYRIFTAIAIESDVIGLKTQDLNLITGLLIIFIMSGRKKCCG